MYRSIELILKTTKEIIMKFNFRTFVNSFFIYLVITVLALVALNFLGELVLATIANAIFGEKYGIKITKIFLSFVWFIVVFITIYSGDFVAF